MASSQFFSHGFKTFSYMVIETQNRSWLASWTWRVARIVIPFLPKTNVVMAVPAAPMALALHYHTYNVKINKI